ncbi:hypothetical protein CRENBAI_016921 [Crenichthys baileyi]|uniref:Ig-like domain-containing protein n=1 Tax=Crenichthys baileyi TaxID=28760 RepID=A0AAV9RJ21_9TELE
MFRGRGLPKWFPKAPPGRKMSRRQRKEENSAQPASLRNSLCGGLWVIASPDIICLWDPDVQHSGAEQANSMLLLVQITTQSHPREVLKNCNDDVTLECPVLSSMDFFSLTWYKDNTPIIRRRKHVTQSSNFSRDAELRENLGLFLPKVKPTDSGTYKCDIKANVGQQNKEGRVSLTVTECVTQIEPTTMTKTVNSTWSSLPLPVKDFPFTWSVTGYLSVAIAKILLSLISIQMLRILSSRRQKNRLCS